MPVERIDSMDDPRVAEYRSVPDPELLRDRGVFVAEGRQVVRMLLTSSAFPVRSVLVSPAALESLGDALLARPDVPVYVMDPMQLAAIVGFNVHRGCLAIGQRPQPPGLDDVLRMAGQPRLIVITEHVANVDNMGGIFRNAAAFGAGAVLRSPRCCDPLYRKAIRVSTGASLRIPFATLGEWPGDLGAVRRAGYTVVALTPHGAPDLADLAAQATWPGRIALMVGHEGDGLSPAALAIADLRARLDMQPGVDSVNVATAAGIALYVCANRWRRS